MEKVRGGIIVWFMFAVNYELFNVYECRKITEDDIKSYREQVVQMFQHAYNNYLTNAYPYDELRPLSCDGMDTWGSFSLTLIDALDTLVVMGNYSEFRRVVEKIISTADFNTNINVSVFETNIRVVGGLLSAHLLSFKTGLELEPGWPCSGPLLRLAENIARRLLPAFQTPTGMPYGTVNLRHGVPPGETAVTCTAGISTFIVEFGTLSRLTGDSIFEETAMKALNALWDRRSSVGLVGNHINVQEGKWTALDAGIGAGVDSYYEYLVKGSILLHKPELMKMFKEYYRVISKYMKSDDWYMWVSMGSGQVTMPIFQSLESFWPGLLTLFGEIDQAQKTLYNYHQVWKQYGFTPEFYDIVRGQVNNRREGYPLRPELIESVMYLYRATRDPHLLEIGVDILKSIQHSARTDCGYATIKNVQDHRVEDRMESFFLAETTKYLYLLFDPSNFIHSNGSCGEVIKTVGGECIIGSGSYIFNTEGHPIDTAAVYCCSAEKKEQDKLQQNFQDSLDLLSILEISETDNFLNIFQKSQKKYSTKEKGYNIFPPKTENLINLDRDDNITESAQPVFFDSMDKITESPTESDKENLSSESEPNTLKNKIILQSNFESTIKTIDDSTGEEDLEIQSSWNDNSQITSDDKMSHKNEGIDDSDDDDKESVLHSSSSDFNSSDISISNPIKIIPVSPQVPLTKLPTDNKLPTSSSPWELLYCPAQQFLARLCLKGEMFNIN
ncbi:ER degradation-enhancing alpha-mannosidase-like protein 2 isoform X1 [Centruroides vittatus]|uniref:ER degradation-enhancing alpha-mannosidase-like protein 2 isoform X1 n=2 Tax=Centruroides vittatus TaxID=120091 RepID=UPI00350F48F0